MIKVCKECGEKFEATDGRQKYCSRQHYRPCPVCGTSVLIVHLSNPTPKCSECAKHRIRKPKIKKWFSLSDSESTDILEVDTTKTEVDITKMKVSTDKIEVTPTKSELNLHSDEYVTRKYMGKTTCGFTHNHIYTVGLTPNNPYGYIVHAIEDQTANDDVNIGLCIASINSWERFFKEV